MEEDDTMLTAEEFFGELGGGRKAPRKARTRGKKPAALFAAVKVKMVMRIYGITRARALELIARREGEKRSAESERAVHEKSERRKDGFLSAEGFFGE